MFDEKEEIKQMKTLQEQRTESVLKMQERITKLEKKCAKAKSILQRLMENQLTPSSMYEEIDLVGWREVNKEAKQFLSEVDK